MFIVFVLLQLHAFGFGQSQHLVSDQDAGTIEIAQWEVHDFVFKTTRAVDSPFDQDCFAIVQSQAGTQRIPLFYNGANTWVFRYSSSIPGEKSYSIESEIDELNGSTGKILISPNKKADRHGGIVLNSKNPQRFFYEDGTHYLNLAFECDWLFALDYGQQEIPKTKHLLSLLNRFGFNQIVMNVYAYDVRWPKDKRLAEHPEHEYGSREDIFPFKGSNSNPNFEELNVDFFKHFDKVISEMHQQEIASHLMIYVWNKRVSWPEMGSKADDRYYDYVIKRYQAFPNIIWDVSKEAISPIARAQGRSTAKYVAERVKRARKLDSYNRLVSVHDFGFCRNHSDLVDFISMQNWKQTLYQHMLDAQKEFPRKPIFNIEHGGYEESPYVVFPGAYTNAEECLRRNYFCIFAGGYTTYYWQGASWNALIHNPFQTRDEFSKPKFEYFTHMRKFCESIHFENCKAMSRYNSSGYNLTNTRDGIVALYVTKETHSASPKKQVADNFDASEATQQWFNTLTGEFTKETEYYQPELGFWEWRPWRNEADAVLIIRNLKPKSNTETPK